MQQTQTNLATGKKVNSALDNPLNFFTSQSLNNRANSLNGLLDSMSNGIQTIQAANNGITSITSLVQQLQSVVSQARADTTQAAVTPTTTSAAANNSSLTNNTLSFNVGGGEVVSFNTYTHTNATVSTLTGSAAIDPTTDYSGGAATGQLSINGTNIDLTSIDGSGTRQDVVDAINAGLQAAGSTVQASLDANNGIQLVNNTGTQITVAGTAAAGLGFDTGNTQSTDGAVATNTAISLTDLANAINSNSALTGKVSASIDANNHLVISNLSTTNAVTATGLHGGNITGDSQTTTIAVAGGSGMSTVRQSLMNQFNQLLGQIDNLAGDSGYNGTNLLNGDKLSLNFNENGTSKIDIQMVGSDGVTKFAVNSANLGLTTQSDFSSNNTLDGLTSTITSALTTLQTQSTAISSSLSVVQTRQDFTKSMVDTLQTGADNLVLADPNQEGANLLALQTRQSLSTTALSMASQADQAVLRLFQ